MKRRTLILLAVIPLLFVVILVVYYRLGGFEEPTITRTTAENYLLAGTGYRGTATDKALDEVFRKTDQLVKAGKLKGTFTICYYGNPDTKTDTVSVFTGVITADTSAALPKGYEWRRLPAREVVRATVTSHVSVAPNPVKVNDAMKKFASEQGIRLDTFYMEKYINERNIVTEIPILR